MVISTKSADAKASAELELIRNLIAGEIEKTRRELREIGITIEQSLGEVQKSSQRHAQVTQHLTQVQSRPESISRQDTQNIYNAAMDAQQRLFVMRGRMEKLQGDKANLENHLNWLEQIERSLNSVARHLSGAARFNMMAQTVEMMIQSQEAERQRLARKMHDGPAQALSNFILQTEIAMRLFDMDHDKARSELASLKTSASTTLQKVRDFIFELRPMMLDDLGLIPTLTRSIDALKAQEGFDIRFTYSGMDQRLEPYVEVLIFRAIQELLMNAARHSQATQVKLQVDASDEEVRTSVDDNGRGMDEEVLSTSEGMGLKVIRDRVEMLGGALNIDSVPGQGTRVVFTIPLVSPVENLPS
jgi:two-component system sensor histidine kinase DegS